MGYLLRRWWNWFVRFWKGIWAVVKSMGNWKGVLSLLIVWLLISGSGVALIGFILQNGWLIGLGTTIYGFWLLPATPLIAINIALAMLVQRFVFQDRNVTWQSIRSKFKEAFAKEEDQKETTSIHEEDSKLLTKEVQDDENNDRK
jgi:pheromone shutdown protein TraB